MKLLTISQVRAGMRTAKPITDRSGNILTNVGVELNDGTIERLKSRRVEFVYIEEANADGSTGVSARELEKRSADVDLAIERMFAGQTDHPVMAALAELGRQYRKRKIQ